MADTSHAACAKRMPWLITPVHEGECRRAVVIDASAPRTFPHDCELLGPQRHVRTSLYPFRRVMRRYVAWHVLCADVSHGPTCVRTLRDRLFRCVPVGPLL